MKRIQMSLYLCLSGLLGLGFIVQDPPTLAYSAQAFFKDKTWTITVSGKTSYPSKTMLEVSVYRIHSRTVDGQSLPPAPPLTKRLQVDEGAFEARITAPEFAVLPGVYTVEINLDWNQQPPDVREAVGRRVSPGHMSRHSLAIRIGKLSDMRKILNRDMKTIKTVVPLFDTMIGMHQEKGDAGLPGSVRPTLDNIRQELPEKLTAIPIARIRCDDLLRYLYGRINFDPKIKETPEYTPHMDAPPFGTARIKSVLVKEYAYALMDEIEMMHRTIEPAMASHKAWEGFYQAYASDMGVVVVLAGDLKNDAIMKDAYPSVLNEKERDLLSELIQRHRTLVEYIDKAMKDNKTPAAILEQEEVKKQDKLYRETQQAIVKRIS